MEQYLDVHLAIPRSLAQSVDRLARSRGLKRAQLVRLALEEAVAQAAREERDGRMRDYVRRMAPASAEFVRETGRSVRRLLLEETTW